jgi:integrase
MVFQMKTEFSTPTDKWSKKKGEPITKDVAGKNLATNLATLRAHILNQYSEGMANGHTIDKDWFKELIDVFFQRAQRDELEYISVRAQKIIEAMPHKVNTRDRHRKGAKVKRTTVQKYENTLNKIRAFEKFKKRRYIINEIDTSFRTDFITYLDKEQRLSPNTIGRYVKFVKSFVLEAQKQGAEISPQMNTFSGYTVDAPKIILDFEELEAIKKTPLVGDSLIVARDWLLIGCYTGQRVSDLLRMNKSMIHSEGKFQFLIIEQVKTGVTVQIPLHHEVKDVLKKYGGDFPPLFRGNSHDSNAALFNRYVKRVCEKAGINKLVEGNLHNPVTRRYENGMHEKWKLVSSHICRRSFASNFYAQEKYPTPLLMNITGHKTERMFLEYIVDKRNKMSLELAKIWEDEAKEKPDTLTIVRSESQAV